MTQGIPIIRAYKENDKTGLIECLEGFADDNGKIVGIIAGIVQNVSKLDQLSFASTKYGRVLELFVHPDYRGNHLGKLLVEKIEDHFKQLHCDHMRIEVFEPNKNARHFYYALGYTDRVIDLIKQL
ncbi:MAG: Ribosomal-protein-alanine acetyltransferase [Candidatus Gottesmanbacteria bacterium GW2011_GWA2_47_9]|uniref:Ribosomal-protein-alanine acetyltransferase n=1 Tax=Candidatus Gottesmanbacteria bacterium GW2011_GWA2_47_9 TaxID=1618445 RepID=A0A0G1WBR0_9BACT|nr:MAG: Ribosomal-protein-alanine acetyltransferase [Candidatus Gottesmanbacteria bacterium GW2011_GWA2_47_9]